MEGQIFEKNVGTFCGLGRETEKYSTQMGRQMPASRFTGDTILKLGPSASVPLLCHRSYSCIKQAARLENYASYSEFIRRTALLEASKIIKENKSTDSKNQWFGKDYI